MEIFNFSSAICSLTDCLKCATLKQNIVELQKKIVAAKRKGTKKQLQNKESGVYNHRSEVKIICNCSCNIGFWKDVHIIRFCILLGNLIFIKEKVGNYENWCLWKLCMIRSWCSRLGKWIDLASLYWSQKSFCELLNSDYNCSIKLLRVICKLFEDFSL